MVSFRRNRSRFGREGLSGDFCVQDVKLLAETARAVLQSIDGDGVVYTGASIAIKDGGKSFTCFLRKIKGMRSTGIHNC